MSLLSLSDISVEFGATTLFHDVTFTIGKGDRWGIVGRNGSGKTSLFKVITGALTPARGAVARTPGLRVSLLDQHRDFGGAVTVWDAAALPYASVMALEVSLAEQAAKLAELGERAPAALLDQYGRDMETFSHEGGYTFHARVDAVLQGLAFDAEESKTRRVATLSGGERGRVGLAAQLVAPADLLLLDEPTNHLDLDTTVWLQEYIRELDETVVVVSHDRAFLDEVADHVLHLEGGTAESYRGGYSSFVQQRAERRLALERQVEKQRTMIAKEEDYIRRNIAGQNTAQAKGRRKRLDRLPRLTPPPGAAGTMELRLEVSERGGDRVLAAEALTVAIGDRTLVSEFTATANRGDVIALVGQNGAGKTTLIKTLLGEREAQGGAARLGGSVTPAYFRQDHDRLPLDSSLYEVIENLRPLWTRGAIQNHLGCFGFSGEEVFRSTRTLSGGERSRLALAVIVLQRANMLVLDEPTNHLDVESIEAIEDAIEEYEGTVLLVSHDRALLRELATRVWAFDGERLVDYGGTFVEWERQLKDAALARRAAGALAADARREQEKVRARGNAAAEQKGQAARRAAQKAADAAEREVHDLERKVADLRRAIDDPALYDGSAAKAKQAGKLDKELAAAQRSLDAALARWAEMAQERG
ncbi:MAG TPA: ABC-F family ATP-binding cassette domain-containing protein [Gemmatimonadaceae bacterium]|nr:ABC-F family ATP-binding cassette domain-containing protein [Gemmatimonadaceae bacterium]